MPGLVVEAVLGSEDLLQGSKLRRIVAGKAFVAASRRTPGIDWGKNK